MKNMNKVIPLGIAFILVAGLSFYGGTLYGKNSATQAAAAARTARFGQFCGGAGAGQRSPRMGAAGNGGGTVSGRIIAKDDTTITIELANDGSRLILLSPSLQVTRIVSGASTDVAVGAQVLVRGDADAQGNLTAKTIQLLPDMEQK